VTLILALAVTTLEAAQTDPQQLVEQGQRSFETGRFGQAANDWEKAVEVFRRQGNTNAEIQTTISLAIAYQALGQLRAAVQVLEDTLSRAEGTQDRSLIILAEWKLGAALVMIQEQPRADVLLNKALAEAKADKNPTYSAAILNDLGNSLASEQKYPQALKAYKESAFISQQNKNLSLTAQALGNGALAAAHAGESEVADKWNSQALQMTEQLEASHTKAFLLLTLGQIDRQIQGTNAESAKRLELRAYSSFRQAAHIAEQLDDQSIETYAFGYLAQLYEQDGQDETALNLTRRAAFAAQQAQMPEALYRWEWQAGQLLKKQGKTEQAIAEYRFAVQTLKPIRNDVYAGYGNDITRSSFREVVGPLYYELADLLLIQAKSTSDPKQQQKLLREARDTVENLKIVELEDYLCDECVDALKDKVRPVEAIDKHSAVIYLIPLPTRTEMLVGLNSGLKLFTIDVGSAQLMSEVTDFRHNLETRTTYGYLAQAQQLYDWFIRPIRGLLTHNQINTLVFVPDGTLRTIPFAALYDGNRFLIQDLAVAVVPGLSMVEPGAVERKNVRLLLNGVSDPVQGFAPLEFVTNELDSIDQIYPSETLLNQQFTLGEFQSKVRDDQFSIIHIASHGQFNRDVHKTFVLTYDNQLSLDDLEASIRPSQYRGQPIELLVLSACQTAAGDDRAALGLAGVAIKAGARSALASLWFVNDQSTSELITEFYRELRLSPTLSKAQALQAAQIKLLNDRRYRHPCYWSPYLMVGNWL
jgi:CHAT domain-containing protein